MKENSDTLMINKKKILDNPIFPASKQLRFVIMLSPSFLCLGMVVMSPVFLNITPEYKCIQDSDQYVREVFLSFLLTF